MDKVTSVPRSKVPLSRKWLLRPLLAAHDASRTRYRLATSDRIYYRERFYPFFLVAQGQRYVGATINL